MDLYSIKVKFKDGEELILNNVTGYKISTESETLCVEFATGYRGIFNYDQVKYVIRELDLNKD